jgi:asparagine synthase (glutamine-hydrolysing)
MSAQAGIWSFAGEPVEEHLLARFSECLTKLGPDGESRYVDGPLALLYRPFHTTAESHSEKQPHLSCRGFVLTWDGRIDNRDELIAELGSDLENMPDVSIVAAAFDRWETDCFRHIRGDWAVSVWRPLQHELILAVDYMAVRHIFYYLADHRIWWATDLSPLVLLSADKFHLDDDYIAGYLASDPDAHRSPYREIKEVPAGQFVRIRNRHSSIERYWRPSPGRRIQYATDREYEEHFRHVFRRSVGRRLRSDSPVLAELSGGLDSSSIVCVADDILRKEGAQTPRLDTLSKYDKTEPDGEDWVYFRKIEDCRGRIGAHIDTSKLALCTASLEYDEFLPLPGYIGIGRPLEAERAMVVRSGGYRAVLSGIGGDEFMGGIPDPHAQLGDLLLQLKAPRFVRELVEWSLVKRMPCVQLLGQTVVDLLPASVGAHLSNQGKAEPWIDRDFARRTAVASRLVGPPETLGFFLPTRRSYVQAALSMANKMAKRTQPKLALEEGRYPFLDQDVIEFVLSIPASQLLRPGQRRSLLRRALTNLVPQEILDRRTKQLAARTPVVAVGKMLQDLERLFSRPWSSHFGYINRDGFLTGVRAAVNGSSIHIVRMVRTIALELWLHDIISRGLIVTPSSAVPSVEATLRRASA